ncbi:PepSY-associated TM helix domain-containing protein [Planctomyces sp. SH-PL62]|uniref:PepSY-associated TM helix domain-containing protein n=1 Tax=Planctomyces sp. SH-PL62 TaxID=1636152 RepID=UPI00078E7410|nr:PepSY-associated TM helix domain-containing protein [Planctomyces sp. SH-PL62]AMV37818.1 hypothetical protein VT85_10300 [Planctomyces sp. SH-PL62]
MDHEFRDVADQAVEEATEFVDQASDEGAVSASVVAEAPQARPALAMAHAAAVRAAVREEEDPTPKGRAWGRDALMVVRRSHLYAGLLLYPWVLLYGVTAFLFNHPTAFPDQTIIRFGREPMKGTTLETLPTPADLAAKVVAAINDRAEGKPAYTLIKPEFARFERGGLAATVQADGGKSYTVSLDRDGGLIRPAPTTGAGAGGAGGPGGEGGPTGEQGGMRRGRGEAAPAEGGMRRGRGEAAPEGERGMRRGRGEGAPDGVGATENEAGERRGPAGGPRAPFAAASGVTIDGPSLDAIRRELPAVLTRAGLADPNVSEVRAAPLSFQMEGEGRPWLVTYNLQTGAVSGRAVDDPASQAELSTRRFLLRLHMIHGYPSEFGQRWIWSFLVDVMAFLMVFWAISGIVMWWQIKRLRRVGAAALVLSTSAAVWIGIGMHGYFVNGGR